MLAWQLTVRLSAGPFHVVRLTSRWLEEERRVQHAEQRLLHREARLPAGTVRAGSERARGTTRARRNALLATYPPLACLSALKEHLRAVYLAQTAPEQRLWFEDFVRLLAQAIAAPHLLSIRSEPQSSQRAMRRWRTHIMMYFDPRLSTALVEGLHTVVKLIHRISFGFRNVTRSRANVMRGLGCRFTLKLHAA